MDTRLFELADLIFAVGRQIRSPNEHAPEWCTPVESTVMRFINTHPGASARAGAEATLLSSSNFSRVLRGLERKGLVQLDTDPLDARSVRIHLTARAQESRERLCELWSRTLDGIVNDADVIDLVNATLHQIEAELIARRRRGDGLTAAK